MTIKAHPTFIMIQINQVFHLEVVEDVADEGDVTHPLLSGPLPHVLSALELLLQPGQEVMAKDAAAVLLRLRLH